MEEYPAALPHTVACFSQVDPRFDEDQTTRRLLWRVCVRELCIVGEELQSRNNDVPEEVERWVRMGKV